MLQFIVYIVHFMGFSLPLRVYSAMPSSVYSLHFKMYGLHSTAYSVQGMVQSVHFTVKSESIQFAAYSL